MARKFCAIILSVLMILSMLPGTALADPTVYTVLFDSQGGSDVNSIPAEEGATISAPADPEKIGYTFEGWYKEPKCENAWVFGADTVTGDITLYAMWTINSYTVTFKDWDGTALKEESVNYGGAATAPTDPTRSGYAFAGWDVAFDNITSALIVTTHYTANQYTLTFDAQDGTVTPESRDVSFGSAYGELPTPERTGFVFGGWYTQAGGEGSPVTAETIVDRAENHTLYAKWTAAVVIHTVSTAQELADALAVVKTKETIKLAADINYTSRISISSKEITFDVGTHTLTVSVTSGDIITVSNGAIHLITSGGEFNAQSSGSTAYGVYVYNHSIVEISNITVSGTTSYCAEASDGSTVTVRGNAVSNGYGVISSGAGSRVTVEGNVTGHTGAYALNEGVVTIEGILTGKGTYIQLNYNYKTKGQLTSPTTKTGYVTYSDATSTVWVKAKPATVTFVVDGEEYATRTIMESEIIGGGQWPGNPVKDGYTFRGWFTGESGTGMPFTAETPVVDTISVYALWRSNAPGTHPVRTADELAAALVSAQDGDTIRLTGNITYNAGIVLNACRELTIDVGIYTLTVTSGSGNAIEVGSGGRLYLDDDAGGALNAVAGYGANAVYVHDGSFAEVSNVNASSTFGHGVVASGAGSNATVHGNVTGYYGAGAEGGGIVTVDGCISYTYAYVEIDTSGKLKGNYTLPTTKDGYLTYTNGTSTVWVKARSCIITFMVDGKQYTTRTILDSESIGSENWPEDPTKANSFFLGWYTSESGTGTQFTADTRIVANITVYTRWRTTFPVATPTELTTALAAAKSGDTIKLTASFTYGFAIHISYKDLTFDVGAYTLTVGPTTSSHTIEVSSGGSLLLNDTGGGALNIVEDGSNSYAVYASNADNVEVTNITLSGDSGYGIYSSFSNVTVSGSITVTGNSAFGVWANGSHVTVGNDVKAYNGVQTYNDGDVTIDGRLIVSNDYIIISNTHKSKLDFTSPTTKDGYLTYGGGTMTVWIKAKLCTVTFQSAGATYNTRSMMEGETVGVDNWPADHVRDGYTFCGWYTGEYGAGTQFTKDTTVIGNITVYARWIGGDYTVTLNAQGGSVVPGSISVTFGNPYGTLPTPVWEGHVFTGWYTQTGGTGTKIESSSFVSVEANHMLYSKWRGHNLTAGTPQQFGQAIAAAVTGDTIQLTSNITYTDPVLITGKDITIDVGAYTLAINVNQSTYPALEVGSGGRLRLNDDGGGKLGISTLTNGIYAHSGGIADVSTAVAYGTGTSYCIYSTGIGSCVTVRGNVVAEGVAAKAENGGVVEVQGDIEVRRNGSIGAEASGAGSQVTVLGSIVTYYGMHSNLVGVKAAGGTVTVLGYVEMSGANSIGVQTQGAGSEVAVVIGIQADGANGLAVSADGGSVYAGSFIQAYDVVWARNGAEVTLDGISYVTHDFIRLGNPPKLVTTPTVPTTQEGYDTYTDGVSTVWDRILYFVTFNNQGDTESIDPIIVYPGDTYGKLPAPTRTGYMFSGWYTQPNGLGTRITADSALVVEADHTLYAYWLKVDYTVKFDSKGGTSVKSIGVPRNFVLTAPNPEPTRAHYVFAGWYKDSYYKYPWKFGTDKVTKSITLYARWVTDTYTATIDPKNGAKPTSQRVVYGAHVLPPVVIAPKRPHYIFNGWTTTGSNNWDFTINTMPLKNITIYARWAPNPHTVTFDANGGEFASLDPQVLQTAYFALIHPLLLPSREHYTFKGWYNAANGKMWSFSKDRMPDEDVILKAKWQPDAFTVTFNSQGGSKVYSKTGYYGLTLTAPTAPKRTGYTFSGWYREAACEDDWAFGTGGDTLTAAITLFAKWNAIPCNITLNANGGTIGGRLTTSVPAYYGMKISVPETPVRDGYFFGGWYTSTRYSTQWNFASGKVTANTTLYAKWMTSQYKVTFNAMGGTPTPMVQPVDWNQKAAEPAAPVRTGYVLEGWYTSSKTFTSSYRWDFATQTVTGSVMLYAHWVPSTYKVTFNAMGGAPTPATQIVDWNRMAAKPDTPPTKSGCIFGGWYTSGKSFTDACKWDFDTRTVTGNMTLYARWITNLGTPKFTAVAAGNGRITITFAPMPFVEHYCVSVFTGPAMNRYLYQLDSTTSTITMIDADPNTIFYFKGWTYTIVNGKTVFGNTTGFVPEAPDKPEAPEAHAIDYKTISLSWGGTTYRYTGYEIWRATSANGKYTLVGTKDAASTRFDNLGLNTGTTYYYKVRAYRSVGTTKVFGAYSDIVSAKCLMENITNPQATAAGTTSVTVSWDGVSGASGYEIWRAIADTGVFKLLKGTALISYTNTALVTGQPYYYKVRAYRLIGKTKVYGNFTRVMVAMPGF